jgi:hypothetical protein
VDQRGGREFVENPNVGTYHLLNPNDGYICTTGREFLKQGTAAPLHVKHVEGDMPFEQILDDIYAQSCLTWTSPDRCARDPITIKLGDIRLQEHAGGFDEDKLEYDDPGQGAEEREDE